MDGENKQSTEQESVPFHETVRLLDTGPKDLDPWRPLHPSCDRIVLQKPMSEEQMRRLGELVAGRPDVELQLLGLSVEDLEFLQDFPGLQRLVAHAPSIKNIEGLRNVADSLLSLNLSSSKARHSLKAVAACERLASLHISGRMKDFEALHVLNGLKFLGLNGHSMTDLSPLLPFTQLQSLYLGFCKALDFGLIEHFAGLLGLHLMKIAQLQSLAGLERAQGLMRIELARISHPWD